MACINESTKARLLALFTVMTALGALTAASDAIAADRFATRAAFIPAGRQIAAPTAFLEMCSRSPEDCQQSAQPEATRIVTLARQAMVEKYAQAFSHLTADLVREPAPGAVDTPQKPRLTDNDLMADTSGRVPDADYVRIDLDRNAMATLKMVNRHVNHSLIADTDAHVYQTNDYWDAPALTRGARGDCEDFALVKRRLLIAQGIPAAALSLAIVRTRFNADHAVLIVATQAGDFVLDNLSNAVKSWQKTSYEWVSRQAPGDDLAWVSLAPVSPVPVLAAPAMRVAYNR